MAMRLVAGDMAPGTPTGGLWMWVGHNPRCMRIFAMTSRCSMKARILIAPPQRGQTSGSTSYTILMRHTQARFAVEGDRSMVSPTSATTEPAGRRAYARNMARITVR